MTTFSQLATSRAIQAVVLASAAGGIVISAAGASEKSPSDTPLIQACVQLEKEQSEANWEHVLGLAAALKEAIDQQAGRTPYTKMVDPTMLRAQANATPGRHTLLNGVRYAASAPPGPKRSYIHTSAVFINGDLTGERPSGDSPDSPSDRAVRWDGYINNSVVVVNGRVALSAYIADSIVIAAGPITVEGYIRNSLVVSLDSLLTLDDRDEPPHRPAARIRAGEQPKPEPAARDGRATVLVQHGYVANSIIVGVTACEDLRDSIILGRTAGREPYLRGADIRSAGKVARLPWEIKGRLAGDEAKTRGSRYADVRQALNDCLIGEADFEAGLLGSPELDRLKERLRRAAVACPEALVPLVRGGGRRAEMAAQLQKTLKADPDDGGTK